MDNDRARFIRSLWEKDREKAMPILRRDQHVILHHIEPAQYKFGQLLPEVGGHVYTFEYVLRSHLIECGGVVVEHVHQ